MHWVIKYNKINKNKILSTHFIRREICLDICNIQIMGKMKNRQHIQHNQHNQYNQDQRNQRNQRNNIKEH